MKKFILILLPLLFFTSVSAKENKLYLTESDNRIYYESNQLDDEFFIKHIDMLPGDSFTDELTIENGTNTNYTIYFKAVPRKQSNEASELIENLLVKIILDGNIIYEGKITGLNYNDIENSILLGEFTPNEQSQLVFETTLSSEYNNTEYSDFSYIDWAFYAQYKDNGPVEIVKIPNTMKKSIPYIIIFSILIILIGIGIVIYARKKAK